MTIDDTNDRTYYTTVAGETTYVYDFRVLEAKDLWIYIDDIRYTDPFTVNGVGDQGGGNVVLDNPITTGQAGKTLVLIRTSDFKQPIDYTPFDPFPANTHEEGLDRAMYSINQVNELGLRALRFPFSEELNVTSGRLPSVDDRADKYLYFNADGSVGVADGTVTNPGSQASNITYDPSGNVIIQPSDTNLQLAIDRLDSKAINKDGDTMVGQLKLPNPPVDGSDAARKGYVDGAIIGIVRNNDWATPTEGGVIKVRIAGNDVFITNNGVDP